MGCKDRPGSVDGRRLAASLDPCRIPPKASTEYSPCPVIPLQHSNRSLLSPPAETRRSTFGIPRFDNLRYNQRQGLEHEKTEDKYLQDKGRFRSKLAVPCSGTKDTQAEKEMDDPSDEVHAAAPRHVGRTSRAKTTAESDSILHPPQNVSGYPRNSMKQLTINSPYAEQDKSSNITPAASQGEVNLLVQFQEQSEKINWQESHFAPPQPHPITEEQLLNEVKAIYAGLVTVERKCIEIVKKQPESPEELSDVQWAALTALHRTLLHEHHDIFLASRHPAAKQASKGSAEKYALPARMWQHGIHSFLELLRNKLPNSLDHMLTFIYMAYSMMTSTLEILPALEETWIECLGDLARYRMAVEENDMRDREVWSGVARCWYTKAVGKAEVGQLHHHLAVLARPNMLQQSFHYYKSLVSLQDFDHAREGISLLFNPLLHSKNPLNKFYPQLLDLSMKVKGHLVLRDDIATFIKGTSVCLSDSRRHSGHVEALPGGQVFCCAMGPRMQWIKILKQHIWAAYCCLYYYLTFRPIFSSNKISDSHIMTLLAPNFRASKINSFLVSWQCLYSHFNYLVSLMWCRCQQRVRKNTRLTSRPTKSSRRLQSITNAVNERSAIAVGTAFTMVNLQDQTQIPVASDYRSPLIRTRRPLRIATHC